MTKHNTTIKPLTKIKKKTEKKVIKNITMSIGTLNI